MFLVELRKYQLLKKSLLYTIRHFTFKHHLIALWQVDVSFFIVSGSYLNYVVCYMDHRVVLH